LRTGLIRQVGGEIGYYFPRFAFAESENRHHKIRVEQDNEKPTIRSEQLNTVTSNVSENAPRVKRPGVVGKIEVDLGFAGTSDRRNSRH